MVLLKVLLIFHQIPCTALPPEMVPLTWRGMAIVILMEEGGLLGGMTISILQVGLLRHMTRMTRLLRELVVKATEEEEGVDVIPIVQDQAAMSILVHAPPASTAVELTMQPVYHQEQLLMEVMQYHLPLVDAMVVEEVIVRLVLVMDQPRTIMLKVDLILTPMLQAEEDMGHVHQQGLPDLVIANPSSAPSHSASGYATGRYGGSGRASRGSASSSYNATPSGGGSGTLFGGGASSNLGNDYRNIPPPGAVGGVGRGGARQEEQRGGGGGSSSASGSYRGGGLGGGSSYGSGGFSSGHLPPAGGVGGGYGSSTRGDYSYGQSYGGAVSEGRY